MEEQETSALAKVPHLQEEPHLLEVGEREGVRLQKRVISCSGSATKEQEHCDEDEDFYEDDDNDSFITINTSEEDSDDTLENSESNDSGVVEQECETPHRSYGVNPIFAKYFNTDPQTVNAQKEFKYVKSSKWNPVKSSKTLPRNTKSKCLNMTKPPPAAIEVTTDRGGYNESCLI